MVSGLNILCFAGNDWWVHNPGPEKHWMKNLASAGNKILYINSIGIGLPRLTTSGVPRRIIAKIGSLLHFLRKPENNLWVFTPFVIPFWSLKIFQIINIFLLSIQCEFLRKLLGFDNYILWAGLPTPALLLHVLHPSAVLYYYQDDYSSYYEDLAWMSVKENDDKLFNRSDIIICASIGMYRHKSEKRKNVYYIPHGISDVFLQIDIESRKAIPDELQSVKKPIVGYWGSLDVTVDQEIICFCASKHPEWSFVFIGKESYDFSLLQEHENIFFLGFKSLELIPKYGIHFDVCIMSFIQNDWIINCCPVKFREYLALGKPVVSVPIIEVAEAYPNVAYIAKTPEEFCTAIERALLDNTTVKAHERKNLVQNFTWEHTTEQVAGLLHQFNS